MPQPTNRRGAYRSRLSAHHELIRLSLDEGVSYRAICERLAREFGLACSLSTLASYINRRAAANWRSHPVLRPLSQASSTLSRQAEKVVPISKPSASAGPKKFAFPEGTPLSLSPKNTHE